MAYFSSRNAKELKRMPAIIDMERLARDVGALPPEGQRTVWDMVQHLRKSIARQSDDAALETEITDFEALGRLLSDSEREALRRDLQYPPVRRKPSA